ncbi:hypothetical protein B0H13DRAFT_1859261 [Mycena leptocephala]|nr:hypothetical protein B0H13DRAFT_1859261 [Mycena leptocephala]
MFSVYERTISISSLATRRKISSGLARGSEQVSNRMIRISPAKSGVSLTGRSDVITSAKVGFVDAMCTEATPITLPSLSNELLVAIAAAGQKGRLPDLCTPPNLEIGMDFVPPFRRFREAIVGAPMLWKLVEANLNSLGSLEIFELYLERSGTCPIWATFQHDLLSSSASLSAKRLSRIVPRINRVCWLRIMLRRAWADEVLAPLRYIAAPKLKHLEIIHPDLIAGSGPSTVSRWTTSLTHFEFFGYDSDDSDGNSLLVAITSSCLFLAHLYLDLTWIPTAGLRFHIPSLKFLSISIQDSEHPLYLRSIAGVFDTPALTEFIIDGTATRFSIFSIGRGFLIRL